MSRRDLLQFPQLNASLARATLEPRFLSLHHGSEVTLGIPSSTSFDVPLLLHWDIEQHRSVPCWQADSCPYCYSPTRPAVYLPAWLYWEEGRVWIRRVICLPDGAVALLNVGRGQCHAWRVKLAEKGNAWSLQGLDVPHAPVAFQGYDILPLLRRMFGRLAPPTMLEGRP